MTCFFDPVHGPGATTVTWSPQWGVSRPVQVCGACAQRVQTTPPPYYSPYQPGYPQAEYAQAPGYPQQGYAVQNTGPQQQGYPAQDTSPQQQGGRRLGAGALIGAGAAGLVGGALLNEAMSGDKPEAVVNNHYGDDDFSDFE